MIGGKVLDASALAALVRGRISAMAWFDTAWALSLPLYLPTLALTEVRAVRPDSGPQLAEILGHPSVILGELDAATADQVDRCFWPPTYSTAAPDTSSTPREPEAGQPSAPTQDACVG